MISYVNFVFKDVGQITGQLKGEGGRELIDEEAKVILNDALTGIRVRSEDFILRISPFGTIKTASYDQKNHVVSLQFAPSLVGGDPRDEMVVRSSLLMGYSFLGEKASDLIGKIFFPSNLIVPKLHLKGKEVDSGD